MASSKWPGSLMQVTSGRQSYRLFVRDSGPRTDHAVLFLHGVPTSSLDWRKIAPRLEDRRAIYFDLLGFGLSEKPSLRYTYSLQADLTLALLDTLEVTSASVVAHDYSVTLAQELLLRQQQRVGTEIPSARIDQVIFLNGGVYGRLHRKQLFHRLLLMPVVGGLFARRMTPKALADGFNGLSGRSDAWTVADTSEHMDVMRAHDGLGRLPSLIHYVADRQKSGKPWEAAMEAAADRIAFVWGPADPVSGTHVLEEVRKRMSSVPAVEIEGAGHWPHWEAPEETADAILRLLEDKSSSRPAGPRL